MTTRARLAVTALAVVALSATTALVAAPSTPSPSATLTHYTMRADDTAWSVIVGKFCGVQSTSAAVTSFQTAAGSNTLKAGRIIHVDPANCPTPSTSTTVPPTTVPVTTALTSTVPATTTTSIPATTTTVAPLGDVAAIPSNFDVSPYIKGNDPAGYVPGPNTGDTVGKFRFLCAASHVGYNDPIVKPGPNGQFTHLHTFFGNTLTDASSTYNSLRTTGQGTCNGGPINRSAYWVPSLIVGGQVLLPDTIAVYYAQEPAQAQALATKLGYAGLPRGLKMVGGFDMTGKYTLPAWQPAWWDCAGIDSSKGLTIPTACPAGVQVEMHVEFPSCWDGRLDSPNHRDHLVYYPNGGQPTVCPADHPFQLPRFSVSLLYPATAVVGRLSSDDMPTMAMPSGSTLHADWFGAWDDTVMARWFTNCVIGFRSCNGGQLGDTTYLQGATGKTGTVPIPAKG